MILQYLLYKGGGEAMLHNGRGNLPFLLFVLEASIERLDVGKYALPVGSRHHDHILDVEQRCDTRLFPVHND